MPRRSNREMPVLLSSWLYGLDASFKVDTPAWWEWLNAGPSFYVEMRSGGGYTARRELRGSNHFWYAFKTVYKKLYKVYIGRTHELTMARLDEVSNLLEERIEADRQKLPPLL